MDSLADVVDALPSYYEALPNGHVRLLRLESDGDDSDVVRCELLTVDLASHPLYNALSYTWGDPRPEIAQEAGLYDIEHTIYINGYPRPVQTNLYHVLLRLRSGCPSAAVPIWIDALCINQADKQEKAVQVRRMDEIYKGANAVFAWLGEADDYTSTGFATVLKLSELDCRVAPNYALHRSHDLSAYGFEEWEWTSLVAVLRRAWFTRVWVVQEVWFARRLVVVCGKNMLPGEVFARAIDYLFLSGLWQKILSYRMMFTPHKDRHAGGPGIQAGGSVAWALQEFNKPLEKRMLKPRAIVTVGRAARASDLRDHVYALHALTKEVVSLAGATDIVLPEVDYSDSVTAVDAFTWLAKLIIGEGQNNFYIFALVEDRSHRAVRGLPSWVPDLSVSMMPLSLWTIEEHENWKPYGANTGGWIIFNDDPTTIEIPAAHFDTVTAITKDLTSLDSTPDYVSLVTLLEPATSAAASSPYHNALEALARVMTADSSTPADQSQELALNLLCWLFLRVASINLDTNALFTPLIRMAEVDHTTRATLLLFAAETAANLTAHRMHGMQAFDVRYKRLRSCRRLIRTRRNYIGLAGFSAEVGDEVCILPAANTPFVFRERVGGTYELVGEAYVQGIMDGEVAGALRWEERMMS